LQALDVNLGEPILAIDIGEIKKKLEHISWVKYAVVERRLPNTLYVGIVERQPMALWQNAGAVYLIDSEGQIIEEKNLQPFSNLLIMIGEDAPLHAHDLMDIIIKDPELFSQISAISRVGGRRWNINFREKLEVKLPEHDTEKAWDYVIKLYKNNRLFNQGITSLDLRINHKLYIK
jgi:cell division protein FtsQ